MISPDTLGKTRMGSRSGRLAIFSASSLVISVPDVEPFYKIDLAAPLIPRWQASLTRVRRHQLPLRPANPNHYWEIGCADYKLDRFLASVSRANFELVRDYRVFEQPYHHFFLLEKSSNGSV